ncbi:MAG: GlsB/YeaQ/YmgE family stress response membrane protein [Nitrospirae bacterium]|nr:GlsB/YeaQ/YmgE family stress response membrane protein [Nitrospirota bacterium]
MQALGLLAVGLVAGLLAGWIRKRRGTDVVGYVVVAVIGSSIGGMLFGAITPSRGQLASYGAAAAGALVLLIVIEAAQRI